MMKEELHSRKSNRYFIYYIVATILLVAAFVTSIGVGKYPISLNNMVDILLNRPVDSLTRDVFYTLRLSRTIMAMVAGIGLAVSGSVYQTVFKNPLATPDIIGVSSGANLGAAIAISFLAGGTVTIAISAFLGGIIAVSMALFLTRISKNKGISTFVLAGIVIGSLSQGLIMMIKFFADPERQLAAIEFWSMGSFASITSDKLISILPFFIVGIIGLILLRWQINILSLSDEEGRSLGVQVGIARVAVMICATLVVASIVSVTGLITFIGLVAPHLARMIIKKNDTGTMILSGLIGAILLLVADTLARSVASSEIPISILTTFIGAPFLAYLMSRMD